MIVKQSPLRYKPLRLFHFIFKPRAFRLQPTIVKLCELKCDKKQDRRIMRFGLYGLQNEYLVWEKEV